MAHSSTGLPRRRASWTAGHSLFRQPIDWYERSCALGLMNSAQAEKLSFVGVSELG